MIAGAALGVAAAYAFDPSLGRQRRHMLRDRLSRTARQARRFADVAARDVRNRAHGAQARLETIRDRSEEISDRVLAERVRAKLGRYVSHPKAIAVAALGGNVDLSGDVLEGEYENALKAVAAVRGVRAIEDRLIIHRNADGVPSLQGGKTPTGEPGELEQRNWAPALRLAAGSIGLALLAYAAAGRGRPRVRAGIVGALVLLRTITNRPLAEIAHRPLDAREVPLAPQPEPGAWNVETPP
jgi:hypothetical protein